MKVLFLTTVLPGKKRMGGEVASQVVIDALREFGAEVTVVGYVRTKDPYRLSAREYCAGRRPIETRDAGLRSALWLAWSLAEGLPYSVAKYWSSALVSQVRNLLRGENYDLVIVDHVQMSWLLDAVPLKGKLVGMAHNVEHQMYQSFAGIKMGGMRRWIYGREGRLMQQLEIAFANKVDQLWVLTKSDAEFFAVLKKHGAIKEIPLPASANPAVHTTGIKEFDIGLVGSWTWKANEEGLRWFFDSIYPHLSPKATIHVAGNGAKWLEGRYDNLRYRGFVADVQEFLSSAKVVAIPTLSGGGIQIKTLDAIASGSRIVATPLAVRGIDDYPQTVTVAETAEDFAAKLTVAIGSSTVNAHTGQAIQWCHLRQTRFKNAVMQGIHDLIGFHSAAGE